jgi:GDPmannose 4,6-dehydratase
MWLMLQQDEPDNYVISTNETHSVREFCELAFERVGLNWQDHVVQDEKFFRPAEVELLVGDSAHARDTLGWKPKTTFEGLIHMMVDADLEALRAKHGIR